MRIAVVVPRYELDIAGGAERLARGFAETAVARGWDVEVWTTCARSHYTWKNVHSPGTSALNGVTVRRFSVTRRDPIRQAEIEHRAASLGVLPVDDQYAWLECGAHSEPLYAYAAAHADAFDLIVALPYVMPLVHYAAWTAPERVVVWPCLHDEPYAYMEPVSMLLESVRGVVFNSPEERRLAVSTLGMRIRHSVLLGVGVDAAPVPPMSRDESSLLYVGRLEGGKNLSLLYTYVQRYVEQGGDLCLVVAGDGPFRPPDHAAFDYRGFVSEEEKVAACAGALALCQPSLNESFSLTVMESWLAGRPVLVHRDCAVTRGHVQRAKGGLWFRTYSEFAACVEWLRAHDDLAARMGRNGREYVRRNYTWESIVDRFERVATKWHEAGTSPEEASCG